MAPAEKAKGGKGKKGSATKTKVTAPAAAGGDDTEGIVEVMRGVRGVRAAALVREAGPPGNYRVSLRTAENIWAFARTWLYQEMTRND